MRVSFVPLVLCLGLLSGCGGGEQLARVKGRVVNDGQPLDLPTATQAAVTFTPTIDGALDDTKSVTAVMQPDGEFELLASGGTVKPGKFNVSLLVVGKASEKFKPFASFASSPLRAELKPGGNDIVIDLAKPNG